ncbi:lipopolysaccharide biosynthesis protein [Yimella sp. cx-51]|uniref:lipopolysaccharide biosynthesis protein n=1 Tax=Yimella sp. cx-51 TaxID=2770551 RepID=UPI00165D83CE|nr:polysaccharide biosynthesis protein [Yimella sp. cx-51]MBC9957459.1 polysaccharide biosynthesis protein [Yimella sp. cx-51]QTH39305.1 hypothetical protein J5M86_06840 [Yimella sp. cx-51]
MSRSFPDVARSVLIAGGIMIMNVTTYGLTLLAARSLGPAEFGTFSAVLGALIILNVLSLGLQSAGARRIARGPDNQTSSTVQIQALTVRAAIIVLAAGVVLAPALARLMDLGSVMTAIALAVSASLLTLMGGFSGILQGEERWLQLSLVYTAMGTARLGIGLVALAISPTALSLCIGVAVAAAVPAATAYFFANRPGPAGARIPVSADPDAQVDAPEDIRLWHEVVHNSHVLLAFFMLSNIDVVVARQLVPHHEAGLYAAGLVLTKGVLFLPQFVVVVAFPAMARHTSGKMTHVAGLGLVALIGLTTIAGVLLLPNVALQFVGGAAYEEVKASLPIFAVVGTVLAMVQLLIYGAIAGRHARAVWLVWLAVGVFIGSALSVHNAQQMVSLKLTCDTALLVVLAAYVMTRSDKVTVQTYEPALVEDLTSPEQPPVR